MGFKPQKPPSSQPFSRGEKGRFRRHPSPCGRRAGVRESDMERSMSFEPLTPTAFLTRAGRVFADRVAVIDGNTRFTYGEFLDRALRLAGALRGLGIRVGDRVAVLAPNTHVLLEAHYGVPFAG